MSGVNKTEYGVELAYKLACEEIVKIDNVEEQCLKSGARFQIIDSRKVIIIEFLNRSYQVVLPDVEISFTDSEERVSIREKVLILHYLISAKDIPVAKRPITYKELPEGIIYFPTFFKRAIKPLLDSYGQEPHLILDIAKKLGGYKADYGDTAVTINAFSLVPVTLVLWKGDEEFAPEGNIIFDSTISKHLTTDDINVLCETIAWRLVRLKTGGDNPGKK